MRDIGKNIRTVRMQKNMTQEELAAALFVTRQTVSNYETGRSRPDIDTLLELARVLNTDANTLIYGLPIPEDRKQARRWLIASGVMLVLLTAAYIVLAPIFQDMLERLYIAAPVYIINLILRPAMLFTLGWFLLHLAGFLCKWKLPRGKTVKLLRLTVLICLSAVLLVMLPFVVWMLIALIKTLTTNSVSMIFPRIPVYFEIVHACIYVILDFPFLWTLLGGLCWLLGLPDHQKVRKNEN